MYVCHYFRLFNLLFFYYKHTQRRTNNQQTSAMHTRSSIRMGNFARQPEEASLVRYLGRQSPKQMSSCVAGKSRCSGSSHGAQAGMLEFQVSRHGPVSRMPGKQCACPSPQSSVLFTGPHCSSSIVDEAPPVPWTSCYHQSKHILYYEAKCILNSPAPRHQHRGGRNKSAKGWIGDQIGETLFWGYCQQD